MNPLRKCEICGVRYLDSKKPRICSSQLGPISLAHCRVCLELGAEPSWLLEMFSDDLSSLPPLDTFDEWCHNLWIWHENKYWKLKDLLTSNVRYVAQTTEPMSVWIVFSREDNCTEIDFVGLFHEENKARECWEYWGKNDPKAHYILKQETVF